MVWCLSKNSLQKETTLGTEIAIIAVFLIYVCAIAFIAYRMISTRRKILFSIVIFVGISAISPLFLVDFNSHMFAIFALELLVAYVIGLIGLIYSHRWQVLFLFLMPGIMCVYHIISDKIKILPENKFFYLIFEISILMAPVFLILATVFCIEAFSLQSKKNA